MQTSTGDFSEAPIYKFKIHSTYKSCSSVFPVLFDGLASSNIDFCSLSSIHDFDHIPPPFWNGTLRKVVKLGKVLASVAEAFYSSIKQAFHEFLTSRLMKKAWKSKYQMIHHTISFVVLIFRISITGIFIQIKISCFQKRSKDGAESALWNNMTTGAVDIYVVKSSLLTTTESKWSWSPYTFLVNVFDKTEKWANHTNIDFP